MQYGFWWCGQIMISTHWRLGKVVAIWKILVSTNISLWLVAVALSLHIFWDGFLWILLMIGQQLEQVMVWCLMAPSNYLIQCWHRSMMLYGFGLHTGGCFEGIGCAEGCQCGSFQLTQNGNKIVINTSILFHWSHFELSIWHDISDVGTYRKIITVKSLI